MGWHLSNHPLDYVQRIGLGTLDAQRRIEAGLGGVRSAALFTRPADSLGLSLIGDARLAPAERWVLIASIARAACQSGREVRLGATPERYAALETALARASDIPRTAEWVALQRAALQAFDRAQRPGDTRELPLLLRWLRPLTRTMSCPS